jgi:hypothetical protein
MRPSQHEAVAPLAKPGRNDPCGSGNKYKKCCLSKDEATKREGHAEAQARHGRPAADHRLPIDQLNAALAAILADAAGHDEEGDTLMEGSNTVLDLVRAGKLDEAEAATRAVLTRYPDMHDDWDRLGMVYEARAENAQAADCYRGRVPRREPDYSEPAFKDSFVKRIRQARRQLRPFRPLSLALGDGAEPGAIRDRGQNARIVPSDTVARLELAKLKVALLDAKGNAVAIRQPCAARAASAGPSSRSLRPSRMRSTTACCKVTLGEQPSLVEKLADLLKSLTGEPPGFTEISAAQRWRPDRIGDLSEILPGTNESLGPRSRCLASAQVALIKK